MITHAPAKSKDPIAAFSPGHSLLRQRKCACPSQSTFRGLCIKCQNKKPIQAKLAIGARNDPLEHEADRIAKQVPATAAHRPVEGAPPHIQRLAGHASEETDTPPASVDRIDGSPGGLAPPLHQDMDQRPGQNLSRRQAFPVRTMESSEVPPAIYDVLNSSGRPLDRNTRAFFEPPFGHDFGRVRVHDDARADTAARALNARAFTVGEDVVFALGEFRTKTAAGRHLLAHELAHVVQQSGGSRPGENSMELRAARPSIQRAAAVETMGGSWRTTKYDLVRKEVERDVTGVDIELNFTPEDPVDAELIGLTQTVRDVHEGKPRFVREASKRRATPGGEEGVERGSHIDQPQTANPLYVTGETGADDTLASTPTALPGISVGGEVRELGQHGWHHRDATGALRHQDAILIDTPLFRDPANNSSQKFETTALAIKGRQEGTYYGSVGWGWETDGSGILTKIPLFAVAAGVPSATFIRSAELWNAATTSAGVATVNLPTPKLPSGAKSPASRRTAGLVIEIARVNKELASMLPGTDKTNKEFEKTALEFALAKRPDKPTSSLTEQEGAAGLLPTPDLIKRAIALPEEIRTLIGEPWVGTTTNRELEWEAVTREIRKRKLLITVHVHETEDVFSDNVYVSAPGGAAKWRSSAIKLNSGDEHTFVAPLSSVFPDPSLDDPASSPLFIEAYDEDVGEDDLMFDKKWAWSDLPNAEKQSRDGGSYTVTIDFAHP